MNLVARNQGCSSSVSVVVQMVCVFLFVRTYFSFTLSFSVSLTSTAWAERRGYKTAKAARNDVYRAANSLLRLAIDGRLCLCLQPPGYTQNRGQREIVVFFFFSPSHVKNCMLAFLVCSTKILQEYSWLKNTFISSADVEACSVFLLEPILAVIGRKSPVHHKVRHTNTLAPRGISCEPAVHVFGLWDETRKVKSTQK